MTKELDVWIAEAKEGSSDALIHIFHLYQPIVSKVHRRYFLKGYDWDDWLQEGRIVCYESIKSYSRIKGVTFGAYYKINFERHIYSLIRKQEAQKRQVDRQVISYDSGPDDVIKESYVFEDYGADRSIAYIYVRDQLDGFAECLSETERKVFISYLYHSDPLDTSQKVVRNALGRTRKKMKQQLFN